MKRSSLNRATPKAVEWQRKKRKTLARVGKRGRVRRAEWAEAKATHLAVEPGCRKPTDEPCRGPLDVHHVIPRGLGGGKDYGVYATLCRAHHEWVEQHRAAARELGLLLRVPSTNGLSPQEREEEEQG